MWSLLQKKLSDLRDCFPFDVCHQSAIVEIELLSFSIATITEAFPHDRNNRWIFFEVTVAIIYGNDCQDCFGCFVLHFGIYRPIFINTCGITLPQTFLSNYGLVLLKLPQIKIDPASLGLDNFLSFLPENLSLFKLRHDSAFDSAQTLSQIRKIKSQKIYVIKCGLLFLSKNNKSDNYVLPSSGKHTRVRTLLLICNWNLQGIFYVSSKFPKY